MAHVRSLCRPIIQLLGDLLRIRLLLLARSTAGRLVTPNTIPEAVMPQFTFE